MADITRLPGPTLQHWEWQLHAACRGMDVSVFYHPAEERNKARDDRIAAAKAICRTCPAINACLEHALRVREPYGVWGGLSEEERANVLGLASLKYPARAGTGWSARLQTSPDSNTNDDTRVSVGGQHG